jgi:hypothetical protein
LLCSTALKQAVRLDLLHYFSLQNAFGILNKVGAYHTHTNNTHLPEKGKSCCLNKSGGLKLSVEISSHGRLGKKIQLLQRNTIPKAKQYNQSA